MRRLPLILSLSSLLSLVCACTPDAAEPVAAAALPIVGGTTDTGDPAVGYVLLQGSGSAEAICSGTLISGRVVLTAAHCADGADGLNPTYVYFGTNPGSASDPQKIGWYKVTAKTYHPSWNGSVNNANATNYDIALLQLEAKPPITPRAINRATPATEIGKSIRFVGFGATSGGSGANGAGLKRQTTSTLRGVFGDILIACEVVSGGQCQSFTHGTCEGDSGGPAFMTWSGTEKVTGVTSFGDQNCMIEGGYTRVDLYASSFIDPWIQTHDTVTCNMDGACAAGCTSPDPDCPCVGDGLCTIACTDGSDPDCPAGCGGGNNQCAAAGCPAVDPDCAHCADDGQCVSVGCATPDQDCAAPMPCTANGNCEAGCPNHDPDCPAAPVGDWCTSGTDCQSTLCIPALDDADLHYCSATCDPAASTCPMGMDCFPASNGQHVCAYPSPTPGALGGPCQVGADCPLTGLCIGWQGANVCSELCDPSAGCDSGFSCIPTSGTEHVCLPDGAQQKADDSSDDKSFFQCAVSPGGARPGGSPWLAALALAMLASSLWRRRR